MPHVLERVQFIPRPLGEVFPFFEDATNLERITPPHLRFSITTPLPIAMGEGTIIDYRLRLLGVPFRWRTRIDRYDPPRAFVDTQLAGPYRLWRHLHEFREAPGGTSMRDRVEYELPFGAVGRLVRAAFVARQLEGIFAYRARVIAAHFGAERGAAP
jgi:ligand-binding SRPBCC domain-containing protein